jgi:5-methylcytosine-specific restriction protein A
MGTFLLTWNPEKWPWPDRSENSRQTRERGSFQRPWSCGNTKRVFRGDRIFLLKQGAEPRGIIASGWAASEEPFLDVHFTYPDKQILYIMVDFERILDLATEAILPLEQLHGNGLLADVHWATQKPGIEIPEEAAAELERLWAVHLGGLDRRPAPRNPPWQRDELILALDFYFRHRPSSISKSHPELIALSQLLNSLPIHADRPDAAHFRNPNGVYMKLCNFLRFDPSYEGTGLARGGALEKEIWDLFANNRELLAETAAAIRAGYQNQDIQVSSNVDEEETFPEGRILFRLHRSRERSHLLVKQAKQKAMEQVGRLACTACGFDFAQRYGSLGEGYIECHHTRPLSELLGETQTRLEDIALVCSNCHRMIHRRRPWLSIGGLSDILAQQ